MFNLGPGKQIVVVDNDGLELGRAIVDAMPAAIPIHREGTAVAWQVANDWARPGPLIGGTFTGYHHHVMPGDTITMFNNDESGPHV